MKAASAMAAYVAIGAIVCGCANSAYIDVSNAPSRRVSEDYLAVGDTFGMNAFVYGKRTVLQDPRRAGWISIKDADGAPVDYERDGQYVRLARQLDRFSVQSYLSTITFIATPKGQDAPPKPGISEPQSGSGAIPQPPVRLHAISANENEERYTALAKLVADQLAELRRDIEQQKYSAKEAKALSQRLDRMEAQLADGTGTAQVPFEFGRFEFKPSPEYAKVLVDSARLADLVNVRGRTDALVAGPGDSRLAHQRAAAARDYLVSQGVSATKIKVYWLGAGDIAATSATAEGRAKNRRVDIEFVGGRALKIFPPSFALAEDAE